MKSKLTSNPADENKRYSYAHTVTIGDTNLLQNMYFANYFKLQGIVRELFVKDCIPNALHDLAEGLVLITHEAQNKFIKDFYLYETISIELQVMAIKNSSASLEILFFEKESRELRSVGSQVIVFADAKHHICRIPHAWRKALKPYLITKSGFT